MTAGQLPTGMTPLVNSNTNVENFAPTGAEGVPNAPLFVPYQGGFWALQLPACAHCLPITSKLSWLSERGCVSKLHQVGDIAAGWQRC